ncbi:MAG: hypothetical protein LBJ62_00950 [Bifidobacteriaceae bacterium]|jgi:hypothetical protein|nr:hypothetical protein [Bifidobacteriaceae bacterium]
MRAPVFPKEMPQDARDAEPKTPPAKKSIVKHWWFWLLIGVAVIAVVGVLIVVLTSGKDDPSVPASSPPTTSLAPAPSDSPSASSEPVSPEPSVAPTGQVYSYFSTMVAVPGPALSPLIDLGPGETTSGNIAPTVPAGGDGVLRVSPGIFDEEAYFPTS